LPHELLIFLPRADERQVLDPARAERGQRERLALLGTRRFTLAAKQREKADHEQRAPHGRRLS
jgi:hypothetical protein